MSDYSSWILVGVDGSEAGSAAIRYGAEDVRRNGGTLRLAHVVMDYAPSATTYSMAYPAPALASRRIGREVLAEAEKVALELLDPTQVETVMIRGDRVPALVQAANGARLVVLGDERRPMLERIATGSVLGGVAAHAPVPVVAVPASWVPRADRPRIVAAVKDCGNSRGLIRRALAEAEERNGELVVLHAWQLPTYPFAVPDAGDAEWEQETREALQRRVESLPETAAEVRIDIRRGQPAKVLVDVSKDADLLVVARRAHGFPFGHLGGTGRAVLRASQCPVEVTPPVAESISVDDLVLEEDGTFQKASDEKASDEKASDEKASDVTSMGVTY